MESFLQDDAIEDDAKEELPTHEGAAYIDTNTGASSATLQRQHIAHLESLCGDLLSLVGDDTNLINEACSQMKKTLGLVSALKARSQDVYDAKNAFVPVHDDFGNTLKRAKPIIEQILPKRRSKSRQSTANSFIAEPKEKRLSMQARLNKKAKKHE